MLDEELARAALWAYLCHSESTCLVRVTDDNLEWVVRMAPCGHVGEVSLLRLTRGLRRSALDPQEPGCRREVALQLGLSRVRESVLWHRLLRQPPARVCSVQWRASGWAADVDGVTTAMRRGALPWLRELHLRQQRLGDAGARLVAESLSSGKCPLLLELDLSSNAISAVGGAALARPLGRGAVPRLRALDLGHNPLECAGARALAGGLRALAALESLRVPRAYLYEIDALVRASPAPLRVLVLDGNGFDGNWLCKEGAAGRVARAMAEGALSVLETLSLRETGLRKPSATSELFAVLSPSRWAGASSLRALRLGGNALGTDGIRRVCETCELPELLELELKKTELEGVASASWLARALSRGAFPRLTELELRENGALRAEGMLVVSEAARGAGVPSGGVRMDASPLGE